MTTTSILTLPRSIYIEPTSRCNELCQQCPRTLLSREDDRDLSFDNSVAISPHIFPWYATALLPWVATLAGRLWIDKRPSGKGLATAMAWYFTCTVLVGYWNLLDWRIYYALVYDVVLLGLAVAIVAEVQRVRATSLNLQATSRDV